MTTTLEPLMDVREVASRFKLSPAHVRRLHARGDLPAVRFSEIEVVWPPSTAESLSAETRR